MATVEKFWGDPCPVCNKPIADRETPYAVLCGRCITGALVSVLTRKEAARAAIAETTTRVRAAKGFYLRQDVTDALAERAVDLEARLASYAERVRMAEDCGQAVVCEKPPGCQRHWEERNRELVAQLGATREHALPLTPTPCTGPATGNDLVDRLRGIYVVPVVGERRFDASEINIEAAARIEALERDRAKGGAAVTPREFRAAFFFCGLGAGALGFIRAIAKLGVDGARFVSVGAFDNDPLACQDFEYLTGAKATLADMSTITPAEIRAVIGETAPDCIFMSSPCLPAHGLVLGPAGARRIDEHRVGDLVLTHRGRFRPVMKVGRRWYDGEMFGFRLNGTVDVHEFTDEHPMWVRKFRKSGAKVRLVEPEFLSAKDVRVGDRIGFPIMAEEPGCARRFIEALGDPRAITKGGKTDPSKRYAKPQHAAVSGRTIDIRHLAESPDLWFLIGAYLGDGYRRPGIHQVLFCPGPEQGECAERIRSALGALGLPCRTDRSGGPTNVKLITTGRHLSMIMAAFGDGAEGKDVPESLMGLDTELLKALINGYRATDGSEQERRENVGYSGVLQARWKIPSVSLPLLRKIQRLLLRLGTFGCINVSWPGGPQVIDRGSGPVTVNTRPRWELVVRLDPKKRTTFEFADGAVWTRVRKITKRPAAEFVWNLEVDEDDTFCAPMMATHNCKGLSSLLSSKQANSPKYQAMNRLVLSGIFLACETWKKPPGLLVLENVPRIRTRGKHLLIQAKDLLARYGYVFHEQTHELGEVGGLGQIRRRYLLVARQPQVVPAYVYRPPRQRVKACGEILASLPIPGDPAAGEMHALPRISWLNWLRLALIPAGGDWRDLPSATPRDPEARRRWEQEGEKTPGEVHKFKGAHGVMPFDQPARSVIGGPSNGAANVADPRVPRSGVMGVTSWEEPSATVVGESYPSNGSASVADPRVPAGAFVNVDRVTAWEHPVGTITAAPAPSSGGAAVADPRLPLASGAGAHTNIMAVGSFDEPTRTVTGAVRPGAGALSVADPRIPLAGSRAADRGGALSVNEWEEPAPAVTGSASVTGSNMPAAVADPRFDALVSPVPVGGNRHTVFMRHDVRGWDQPARTVAGGCGSGSNGGVAVADPRAAELAAAVGMNGSDGWSENRPGLMGVNAWTEPTRAVVGRASISSGNAVAAVADPRAVALSDAPARHRNKYQVGGWDEPAQTVTGATRPGSGAGAAADPRRPWNGAGASYGVIDWRTPAPTVRGAERVSQGQVAIADPRLTCAPRAGTYGVLSWEQAAHAITGNARIDNGTFAIADPRFPVITDPKREKPEFTPVIIAADGTWHRPLTTLELAALQGLPATVEGAPLRLAGKAVGKWRERIGNAVPVQAATAIAETLLKALLAAALGTWTLGSTGIWVRDDGVTEDDAEQLSAEGAAA